SCNLGSGSLDDIQVPLAAAVQQVGDDEPYPLGFTQRKRLQRAQYPMFVYRFHSPDHDKLILSRIRVPMNSLAGEGVPGATAAPVPSPDWSSTSNPRRP